MSTHSMKKSLGIEEEPDDAAANEVIDMLENIPDDPDLHFVVKSALQQYYSMLQEANNMEPEEKLNHMELARDFLKLAKDTMVSEEDIKLRFYRAQTDRLKKQGQKVISDQGDDGSSEDGSDRVSRDSAYAKIERLNQKKQSKEKPPEGGQ